MCQFLFSTTHRALFTKMSSFRISKRICYVIIHKLWGLRSEMLFESQNVPPRSELLVGWWLRTGSIPRIPTFQRYCQLKHLSLFVDPLLRPHSTFSCIATLCDKDGPPSFFLPTAFIFLCRHTRLHKCFPLQRFSGSGRQHRRLVLLDLKRTEQSHILAADHSPYNNFNNLFTYSANWDVLFSYCHFEYSFYVVPYPLSFMCNLPTTVPVYRLFIDTHYYFYPFLLCFSLPLQEKPYFNWFT